MSKVTWKKGTAEIDCRLCGFRGSGRHLLRFVTGLGITVDPIECPNCASLEVLAEPQYFSQTEFEVASYLEVGVGIDSIAGMVCSMPQEAVKNFVDVGCGFGFSLAFASDVFGWNATGFEPSLLGVAGASALGVDIRNEFFEPGSELTGTPDFILSSEVVEHVPNPLAFLETLRSQMSESCVLMLSTPNRAVVSPNHSDSIVEAALSPGFHAFVASAEGMRALLRRAGFVHFSVVEEGETLIMSAAHSPAALERFRRREVSRAELNEWYGAITEKTEPGSSVRIAAGRRLFDSLVASGDLVEAQHRAEQIRGDLKLKYGTDNLNQLVADAKAGSTVIALPTVTSLAYGEGVIALLGTRDAHEASIKFQTSIDSVRKWLSLGAPPNPHLLSLARESFVNRLIALARIKPDVAQRDALATFDLVDVRRPYLAARVLVEAVAHGHDGAVGRLARECLESVHQLTASSDDAERVAGQDALFMLAGMNERAGAVDSAIELYERCIGACLNSPAVVAHEISLIRHSNAALDRLDRANHVASEFLRRITLAEPLPPLHFGIDSYSRDSSGVFVEGWAHLGATPVRSIRLRHGDVVQDAERKVRSDLDPLFGDLPKKSTNGFRAFIPGGRGEFLDITLTTSKGDAVIRWQLPLHPLPQKRPSDTRSFRTEVAKAVSHAPDGPVLAIGIRTDDANRLAEIRSLFGSRQIVSLDIHAGPGVDVVGDIHDLRAQFAADQFAVVFSESVIEHLAMPWVAVLEMLRVVKPGGIMAHSVPWVWPSHSQPNDFFRVSAEGLQTLFSVEIGCRTMVAGESDVARVIPEADRRSPAFDDMPSFVSPSTTWIITEKVSDAGLAASWPYDSETGRERAHDYPVDGIAQNWGNR
ncbi:unannotated protein [freshwater metagenome]|uniref:Unannotated protein n=1 Tax=freshwater metagenome TaxID=449393 RepID=A0A6J6D1Y8_9ZZZZ|nr:methyltransferase domain-containing protein [Actinomycetota bacterium]